MKFGTNSFLVLQFTERYRREQQRKDQQGTPARRRRASSPSSEKFSIRFRTRHDGLLLLAMDSAMISDSGYTALQVTVTSIWCLSLQLSAVLFLSVASFFRGCFGGMRSRNTFLANQKPMQCDQYVNIGFGFGWVQIPPWSEFSSVLVWAHFHDLLPRSAPV